MNGAPESQTAASASHLVGPYPIDEDALRRLKRSHDDGVIDAHEFKRRKAEALGLREGSLAWASHAVSLAAPTPRQTFPVRPELFKFTDPRAVCQLSGTSKTLQIDLQGTKAWALLAEAQHPPPTPRDDNEARSHVLRREIAKASPPTRRVLEGLTLQQALSRETPAEVAFTPDSFSDFTYFVRLTDGERLIWEGDLGASTGFVVVDGRELHLRLRHANLEWMGRAGHVKRGCKIALVAIRDHDQAMVSLGHFELDRSGKYGLDPPYGTRYGFHRSTPLFSSARSRLHLLANLTVAQDATVLHLELRLCHLVQVPQVEDVHRNRGISDDNSQFRHVLTHLAGIHHPATRASSSYIIDSWFVAAERRAGWATAETGAGCGHRAT